MQLTNSGFKRGWAASETGPDATKKTRLSAAEYTGVGRTGLPASAMASTIAQSASRCASTGESACLQQRWVTHGTGGSRMEQLRQDLHSSPFSRQAILLCKSIAMLQL